MALGPRVVEHGLQAEAVLRVLLQQREQQLARLGGDSAVLREDHLVRAYHTARTAAGLSQQPGGLGAGGGRVVGGGGGARMRCWVCSVSGASKGALPTSSSNMSTPRLLRGEERLESRRGGRPRATGGGRGRSGRGGAINPAGAPDVDAVIVRLAEHL